MLYILYVPCGKNSQISMVYIYVMENFKEGGPLDEAANILSVTPNAFCRFFKRHTQKTFSKFVNEIPVGHACKLLLDRTLTVSKICYGSGDQNLTNFNKFFRSIMRQSPREYRAGVAVKILNNKKVDRQHWRSLLLKKSFIKRHFTLLNTTFFLGTRRYFRTGKGNYAKNAARP